MYNAADNNLACSKISLHKAIYINIKNFKLRKKAKVCRQKQISDLESAKISLVSVETSSATKNEKKNVPQCN